MFVLKQSNFHFYAIHTKLRLFCWRVRLCAIRFNRLQSKIMARNELSLTFTLSMQETDILGPMYGDLDVRNNLQHAVFKQAHTLI